MLARAVSFRAHLGLARAVCVRAARACASECVRVCDCVCACVCVCVCVFVELFWRVYALSWPICRGIVRGRDVLCAIMARPLCACGHVRGRDGSGWLGHTPSVRCAWSRSQAQTLTLTLTPNP